MWIAGASEGSRQEAVVEGPHEAPLACHLFTVAATAANFCKSPGQLHDDWSTPMSTESRPKKCRPLKTASPPHASFCSHSCTVKPRYTHTQKVDVSISGWLFRDFCISPVEHCLVSGWLLEQPTTYSYRGLTVVNPRVRFNDPLLLKASSLPHGTSLDTMIVLDVLSHAKTAAQLAICRAHTVRLLSLPHHTIWAQEQTKRFRHVTTPGSPHLRPLTLVML